jgi:hypothetical protein
VIEPRVGRPGLIVPAAERGAPAATVPIRASSETRRYKTADGHRAKLETAATGA